MLLDTYMTNTAATITAAADTDTLIGALLLLNEKPALTHEERLAQAWMYEAIEARFDVKDAMDAWADDLDTDLSYTEALLAALPEGVA